MRIVVRRSEAAARRAPLAFGAALCVVAAGSVMAAPGLGPVLGLGVLSGVSRDGYAVRFALPDARRSMPIGASPVARDAPLAEIAEAPLHDPDEVTASVELAATSALPVPTTARTTPRTKVPGIIALSYNLAGGANSGDSIEVEKAVSIGGADAGRIALRIDGNAKVFALGSRLAAIIAAQSGQNAVPEGLGKDFVSLEALRALGIGVKYDAIRDRLVLDPPAA